MSIYLMRLAGKKTEIADCVNELAPAIQARLAQGFRQKNDGSLFKKDHDDIRAIYQKFQGSTGLRIIFSLDKYSASITVDGTIPAERGEGCEYVKEFVYLWDTNMDVQQPFEPRIAPSYDELVQAKIDLKEKLKQRSELDSEISHLRMLLDK